MSNLLESLALVAEFLPDWMLGTRQRAELLALAAKLPSIHHAGFEYRLGMNTPGLDLQQGFVLSESSLAKVALRLQHHDPAPGLEKLQNLLLAWRDSPGIRRCIRQAWLEYDHQGPAGNMPSIFIGLQAGLEAALQTIAIEEALGSLVGAQAAKDLRSALSALLEEPPQASQLSHVGLMLSRPQETLRAVYRPHQTAPVAGRNVTRYAGDSAKALGHIIEPVASVFSELRWCRNPDKPCSEELGLECFFPGQEDTRGREAILDWLLGKQLCTNTEAELFRSWPRRLSPLTNPADWPASLIAESLSHGQDEFTVLECRLGHIKLTYSAGRPIKAKIYFGYLNRWMTT